MDSSKIKELSFLFKIVTFFLFLIPSIFAISKEESVVCIHGFMGASWNMHFLEKKLRKDGWDTINWHYPSRDRFIEEHAKELVSYLISLVDRKPKTPIHFVAHSMGSLVLLAALNDPLCPQEAKVGKVVLLAPPLKGSYWARWVGQFSLIRWIAKDFSGYELMTKPNFDDLGNYPSSLEGVLVIAGSLGFNPICGEKNDGTLALKETFLSTPHERAEIKRGHKTIIFSKKAHTLISQFLKNNVYSS